MNLYIKTNGNGNTISNPAFEDNLIEAFGFIPPEWEPFVRVESPICSVYQIIDPPNSTYQKVNGIWTDVWTVRDMTEAEKTALQQEVQTIWASEQDINKTTWIFDEATCSYIPPIPKPTDGNYFWQGKTNSWVAFPKPPMDGKQYKFDFSTETWVLLTT
jgi:hypothetical protein